MAQSVPVRRTIAIRASRDTLMLVACAVAATFAIAYAVHIRPLPDVAPQQDWVGRLADVSSEPKPVAPTENVTSASLVVPAASLAPPSTPRAAAPAKPRSCDGSTCAAKTAAAPLPPARQKPADIAAMVERVDLKTARVKDQAGLVSRLNPLNHLPDAVRHPFDSASTTISGWIRRL